MACNVYTQCERPGPRTVVVVEADPPDAGRRVSFARLARVSRLSAASHPREKPVPAAASSTTDAAAGAVRRQASNHRALPAATFCASRFRRFLAGAMTGWPLATATKPSRREPRRLYSALFAALRRRAALVCSCGTAPDITQGPQRLRLYSICFPPNSAVVIRFDGFVALEKSPINLIKRCVWDTELLPVLQGGPE